MTPTEKTFIYTPDQVGEIMAREAAMTAGLKDWSATITISTGVDGLSRITVRVKGTP